MFRYLRKVSFFRGCAVSVGCGLLVITSTQARAADVVLVDNGAAKAAIYVAPEVMSTQDKDPEAIPHFREAEAERQRQRLRESVRDLAYCFEKMSGAQVAISTAAPAPNDNRVPIFIGDLATQKFGPPKQSAPFKQGFRVVVAPNGIGLMGESNLATSYAIYEVLDRLGCRWFMPTEMGECIPEMKTIALPEMDFSSAPGTIYRGIWKADDAYRRRNRLGGLLLNASHALGSIITAEQLKQHPDWVAVIHGKPAPPEIKWSKPEVASAIADNFIEQIDRTGRPTLSLSPEDTIFFDESEDPKIDANDFDPIFGSVSLTDRLMVLANRVAQKVTAKYPDTLFGMLAYVNYTRPPVREKVHPNIVPQIAPITYSRAHPMTDDKVPGNPALRNAIQGWGKAARMTSIYFFGHYLAEQSAPNPMITKWSVDVPFVLKNNCQFFQPETDSVFETTMHALYLGPRLAWNPALKPEDIIADLHTRFYGNAAKEMAAYWHYVDSVWVDTPEYSGAGAGHMRRFTPERMAKLRELLNAAIAQAKTPQEKARVTLANESLKLFEQYMKMRRDFIEGRFDRLPIEADTWVSQSHAMAERYRAQYAFSTRDYGAQIWGNNNGVDFFNQWYHGNYDDAARIARHYQILTPEPLRQWRYMVDKDKKGEGLNWQQPAFDDKAWKTTDIAVETWSTLGHHDYFGRMWYRNTVKIPAAPAGRKTFLWIASTDGSAKVFVNGRHVPYINAKGEKADEFVGFMQSASFDISAAIKPDAENQITIMSERRTINEIGTGGLMGPIIIYREK